MPAMTPSESTEDARAASRSITKWIASGVLALAIIIPIVYVLATRDSSDSPTTLPATTAPTAAPDTAPPTSEPITESAEVALYFLADHIVDSNVAGPHLMPVSRAVDVAVDSTVEQRISASVLALIDGTIDEDRMADPEMFSGIPSGTELLGAEIDPTTGIVTLDFNQQFASGGGTFNVTSRLAQVVYTATALDGADSVLFRIDGDEVDVFSAEGLVIDGPQTRADYEDFLPIVLIESPLSGAEVTSPITVSGLANAFEATVSLRIETLDSTPLVEGFTTATCGTGCFGSFSSDLYFDVDAATPARVVALEYSARDGAPINVFSVPVTLNPGGEFNPPIDLPRPRQYDIDVGQLFVEDIEGTVVARASYGDAEDEVGLDVDGAGPCCFDVSGEGDLVVLDVQNARLLKFADGKASVLYVFDPADISPDAVAIIGDKVIVIGLTNRPTRPYDAVAVSLTDGELLKRVETSVDDTGDLRTTSEGVYWARGSSNPKWLAVADGAGALVEGPEQRTFTHLPGESTLSVFYDAGIEVNVQPAGDSPLSTYDVATESASFADVLGYQRFSDGALVVLGGPVDNAGVVGVTVVALGTAGDDGISALAYGLEVERATEVGSFNTFRYGFAGFYALHASAEGMEIIRYELG